MVRLSATMQHISRRLLTALPVLFGVTLITFFVLDVLPGNAARQLLGVNATEEQVAQLEGELGLNRPAPERYAAWIWQLVKGDMGVSIASRQPVSQLIAERLPVSLQLIAYTFALSLVCAVSLALLAARRPGGLSDRAVMLVSMAGLSIANYILALLLVLVFAVNLQVFPSIGFTPLRDGLLSSLRSLTLPAIAIAVPLTCLYTRFLRGDLVEQLTREDYVLTAISKGVGQWRVLIHHVFRNSIFGLLTVVGLNFSVLISGTVIIEQIFAIPGLGQLLLQAINTRDVAVVQAVTLLVACSTVLANLLVDLMYTVLDPRVRYAHP